MRKSLFVIGTVLLSALVASAGDDFNKYEAFLGYSLVRFNPNSGCSAEVCGSDLVPSFNANGGDGQFVYNLHQNFGLAFDLGAITKGTLHTHNVDNTVLNFVIGPRFTYHESPFQLSCRLYLAAPTRPLARSLISSVTKSLLRLFFGPWL